ncbi:MAG: transposase [Candidatus Blackburnbacteria bacterium]|nr:transposase [Candidatus Blackburnbacteria bacterium]
MPPKNSAKTYIENGYYHIYNRGVEKRLIYQDQQDYGVYLSYLKTYLLPVDRDSLLHQLSLPITSAYEKDQIRKQLRLNNFADEIKLLAYSLMPNHFHLLVKQKSSNAIDSFMNSLSTRYTLFFNRKYKRVGSLHQDVYKAVMVESDEQLTHLTRYVHKQALPLQGDPLQAQPSSYPEYCGMRKTEWVHPEEVLAYFSKKNPQLSYQEFMGLSQIPEIIGSTALDEEPEY